MVCISLPHCNVRSQYSCLWTFRFREMVAAQVFQVLRPSSSTGADAGSSVRQEAAPSWAESKGRVDKQAGGGAGQAIEGVVQRELLPEELRGLALKWSALRRWWQTSPLCKQRL